MYGYDRSYNTYLSYRSLTLFLNSYVDLNCQLYVSIKLVFTDVGEKIIGLRQEISCDLFHLYFDFHCSHEIKHNIGLHFYFNYNELILPWQEVYGHYHHRRWRTATFRMVYKCRTSWEVEIRVEIGQVCVCDVTYEAACDWPRHGCVCSLRGLYCISCSELGGVSTSMTSLHQPLRVPTIQIQLILVITQIMRTVFQTMKHFFLLVRTVKPLKYKFSYLETTEKIKWWF